MSPWEGRYSPEPINAGSDLRERIREEATTAIRSQSLLGSLVPRSIPAAAVIRPFVTALPVSAEDGDEIRYLADSSGGVVWHFRYRSNAPSAYRWEFVGGAPLEDSVATSEATTSTSYVDLSTVGPTVSVPSPGEYDVRFNARVIAPSGQVGLVTISSTDYAAADTYILIAGGSASTVDATVMAEYRLTFTSAQDLSLKYRSGGGGSTSFVTRNLRITPIRIGRS